MEDSKKVSKDMIAFFDWLITTFDEMIKLSYEKTWHKTLRIVNDWRETSKLSYKLFTSRSRQYILVSDDLYQKLKKAAFHFFVDFVDAFNSRSPYFELYGDNLQLSKQPGSIAVCFYFGNKQGLTWNDVKQKIKEEN